MCIAGEITEYEESYLQQLILSKDPSVKEALRRFSLSIMTVLIMCRGESQSLIQLLHACDEDTDLLVKKDQDYAQYIATTNSDDHPTVTQPQGMRDEFVEQASSSLLTEAKSTVHLRDNGFEQMYASLYNDSSTTTTTTTITPDELRYMKRESDI